MPLTTTLTPLQEKAILGIDLQLYTNNGETFDSSVQTLISPPPTPPTTIRNQFDYLILLRVINSSPTLHSLPSTVSLPAACNLAGWAELDALTTKLATTAPFVTCTTLDEVLEAGTPNMSPLLKFTIAIQWLKQKHMDTNAIAAVVARYVLHDISPATLAAVTALLSREHISFPKDALQSLLKKTYLEEHALALWATVVKDPQEAQSVQQAIVQLTAKSTTHVDPVQLLRTHVTLLKRGATDNSQVEKLLHDMLAVAGHDAGMYKPPLAQFLQWVYGSLRDYAASASSVTSSEVLKWAERAAQCALVAPTSASSATHAYHAVWAHRCGDDKEALKAAKRAVKADPDGLPWLNLYAMLLSGDGEEGCDTAVVVLTQLVERIEEMEPGDAMWRRHAVHSHLLLVMLLGDKGVDALPGLFAFVNRVFPSLPAQPLSNVKGMDGINGNGNANGNSHVRKHVNQPVMEDTSTFTSTCIGPKQKLSALLHLHRRTVTPANATSTHNTTNTTTTTTTTTKTNNSTSTDNTTLNWMWCTLAKTLHLLGDTSSALQCIDEARRYSTTDCDIYEAVLHNDYARITDIVRSTPTTATKESYVTALAVLHTATPTTATRTRLHAVSQSPQWCRSGAIALLCDKPDVAVHGWFGLNIDLSFFN